MSGAADKLVYMANQIAAAFRTHDHNAAVEATLDHLNRFWDPSMRRALKAYVDGGGSGLSGIAFLAAQRLHHAIPRASSP